jgi:periplasmic protein TonB
MELRAFAPLVGAVCIAAALAGCSSAPSAPAEQAPAPIILAPRPVPVAPSAAGAPAASGSRLAARDPALEDWKRQAAERIHSVNAKQLFDGRPHHLLQAVIVMDVTVDRSGQVTRSRVVRSPGIGRLDSMAQASLKAASPLPAPPAALVKTGAMTYSETWLVANDGRWRLRTLSLPQE